MTPERIWAFDNYEGVVLRSGGWCDKKQEVPNCTVEYVRADLHATLTAERDAALARAKVLEDALYGIIGLDHHSFTDRSTPPRYVSLARTALKGDTHD